MKQIAIFASMLMLVIACGNGSGKSESNKVSSDIEVYKASHNEARPIVEVYFRVAEALVASDLDQANHFAMEYTDLLTDPSFDNYKEVKNVVKDFAEARSLEDKRVVFSRLSQEVYHLVKNGNLPKGELFLMHCPMAFDNKGANWISFRKEVLNPYFGDEMLGCGSIVEEL